MLTTVALVAVLYVLVLCSTVKILSDAGIKEDTNEGVCYEEYLLLLNGARQLCHIDSL